MRLSIIVPVLNSYEIVRRQLLYLEQIGLNDFEDVELILVDDGSDPPIEAPGCPLQRLRILQTHDMRPWTSSLARNFAAKQARGTNLLMLDIDYILTRKIIEYARNFTGDRFGFLREFAVLDEQGRFTQDWDVLMAYGLPRSRLESRGTKLQMHPNAYCMRAAVFAEMGGYREDLVERPYPQGEDRLFKQHWEEMCAAGRFVKHDHKPTIYMFPSGQYCGEVDADPLHLFHTLSRKTAANPWYVHARPGVRSLQDDLGSKNR